MVPTNKIEPVENEKKKRRKEEEEKRREGVKTRKKRKYTERSQIGIKVLFCMRFATLLGTATSRPPFAFDNFDFSFFNFVLFFLFIFFY